MMASIQAIQANAPNLGTCIAIFTLHRRKLNYYSRPHEDLMCTEDRSRDPHCMSHCMYIVQVMSQMLSQKMQSRHLINDAFTF